MLTREASERAFEDFCYRQTLSRLRDRFRDPQFWLALCPDLHITLRPFDAPREAYRIAEGDGPRALAQIAEDGYFAMPPIVTTAEAGHLRRAIEGIAAANYPSVFACVFDEFWRLFQGLEPLMSTLLGDRYFLVPEGLWAFFVPPGHSGQGKWAAASPHRDSLGPDPAVLAHRTPSLINLWIPLTDAGPLNSCMYVVPAPFDPMFYEADRDPAIEKIAMQDVRAVPALAGSVLGWSTHLLHWGSRSSVHAIEPRISVSMYLQRGDVAPFYKDVIGFEDEVPFEKRLEWIAKSMSVPDVF